MKTPADASLKVDGNRHLNGMKIDSNALKDFKINVYTSLHYHYINPVSPHTESGRKVLSSGTRRTDCV